MSALRPDTAHGGAATPAPPPISVNILIVDDDPKNLSVLETVLDDPGYRLVRAESGQQALLALMADEFAVLVLDVRMPDMSGIELAQVIKQRRKTAQVPIIFLTAYSSEEQIADAGYETGAVDFLHKPVNPAVLRSKVAVFAELNRKGRALEIANRALTELNESLDQRVTERTLALQASEAQLRDANRRKDEFLATLAHELRNPLAPVRNAVHVMRLKGGGQPEVAWASDLIERQVKAMAHLIDDLMDVSRIDQNRIELRRELVDVSTVMKDAIEASMPLIEECGHSLVMDMPKQDLLIEGDPTRLAQAFMNLLNNAAKYTDRGGKIGVTVRQEGDEIVARIRDSGIGIAPEALERVFDMFSQVESALARSRGGLGIGLALTRRLVELHGGRVVASSDGLGLGALFELRLPLAADARASEPQAAGPFSDKAESRSVRVLIADDNVDAAETLAALLEIMGHEVRAVHDGEAAVAAVAEFGPQLVLLDIGMPKLNGYEACRKIRTQPGGRELTVVAITGWGQQQDRQRSSDAGFDRHIVKPIDLAILQDLVSPAAVLDPDTSA